MNAAYEIAELNRRLGNLLRLGKITAADYSGPIPLCRVRIGALVTGWLPMLTQRAGGDRSSWHLEEGEQVAVFSPSGELHQGVVLGAINQSGKAAPASSPDKHRHEYQDGAVIEYDRGAHHYQITLPAGATIAITAPGGTQHVGDLVVMGNVSASGDVSDGTRSMAQDREIYNGHDHPHGDPTTGKANQQQ